MASMFFGCSGLTSLDLSHFDTSLVTNMASMFQNCSSLTSLDVSDWDTSKVTNMVGIFQNCSKLTSLDLSSWDTSKVTLISDMFSRCSNLNTLKWNNWKLSVTISQTVLTQESTKDIVSKLATVDTSHTLTLGSTLLSYLTEDEIAAATNKGWTLA